MMLNRMKGPYAPAFWALIFCNVLVPQLLWSRRVRSNLVVLFMIAIVVNVGMWLERFVIVVTVDGARRADLGSHPTGIDHDVAKRNRSRST